MPIEFIWESDEFLVRKMTGRVQLNELIDSMLEMSGDPRFDSLKYLIGDWQGADQVDITEADFEAGRQFLDAISLSCGYIKNAVVINDDERSRKLAEMYKDDHNEKWTVKIFYDINEARAWLKSN